MLYTIQSITRKKFKTDDYAVVGLTDVTGAIIAEATIWKKQKDESSFPNFEGMTVGYQFEGNPWTNPKNGKLSIYPPKPSPWGASKSPVKKDLLPVSPAQIYKTESIEKHTERKEDSYMISGTARDATMILCGLMEMGSEDLSTKWHEQWLKIRYWLVSKYHQTEAIKVSGTDTDYPEADVEPIPF